MKYSPFIYAKALSAVIAQSTDLEQDLIVNNFKALLAKNGDLVYLDKITEHLENILVAKAGGRVVLLETARVLPESENLRLKSQFGAQDVFRQKINPTLVAGVRITINGSTELDLSLSRRLNNIFK